MENEKRERLSQMLKEVLTEAPELRTEILSEIDSIGPASVDREIESWAKKNNK